MKIIVVLRWMIKIFSSKFAIFRQSLYTGRDIDRRQSYRDLRELFGNVCCTAAFKFCARPALQYAGFNDDDRANANSELHIFKKAL